MRRELRTASSSKCWTTLLWVLLAVRRIPGWLCAASLLRAADWLAGRRRARPCIWLAGPRRRSRRYDQIDLQLLCACLRVLHSLHHGHS